MGFFDDVSDFVDDKAEEAEEAVDDTVNQAQDAVDDAVDTVQETGEDVAEATGTEKLVDTAEDFVQQETGIDLGGSGGGRNNPDVNNQGSDDSAVSDADGGTSGTTPTGSSSFNFDSSGGSGGSSSNNSNNPDPRPQQNNNQRNRNTQQKDEVLDMTERLQEKSANPYNRPTDILQEETPVDIYQDKPEDPLNNKTPYNGNQTQQRQQLRRTAARNPDLANKGLDLIEARNSRTNEEQRKKDPIPGDIAARLQPGRQDRINNIRKDSNQPDNADFSDLSNLDKILFGDAEFGDTNKDDNFDYQDVKRFADTSENLDLTEGEVRTIVGEGSAQKISNDTSNFLDAEENPAIRFIGQGFAGLTSTASEGADSLDKYEDFNQTEARTVTEEEVDAFSNVVGDTIAGAVALPFQAQRRGGQGQQIQTGEMTSGEALQATLDSLDQTVTYAGNNPGKFAASAGTGFLLGGPIGPKKTGTITRNTLDKASDTTKTTGRKLDPATGIGREPLPGEPTTTTPEKVRAEAENFVDFLKGDIQPNVERTSEGKTRITVPSEKTNKPTFEGQERIEFIGNDLARQPQDIDGTVSIDPLSQDAFIETTRNRRDVVKEKFDSVREDVNDRLNTGTVGLGPGALLKDQDLKPDTKDPLRGRDSKDLVDDRLRQPDNSGPTLRDRIDRDPRTRNRKTEFNKPKPDNDIGNRIENALATGLGLDQGQEPQPVLDDIQEQGQEQPFDNPLKEDLPQENDNPLVRDNPRTEFESFFQKEEIQPRLRDRDNRERRRRRDRDFDIGFELDREESQDPLQDDFVGGEEEGEFAESLTATLFDIRAEENFEEEEFLGTGLEVRPLL